MPEVVTALIYRVPHVDDRCPLIQINEKFWEETSFDTTWTAQWMNKNEEGIQT
jgi:hypothetical protein